MSKIKTENLTQLDISIHPNKSNQTEFAEEFALSVDFAHSYKSNIDLMGDYNPNYFSNEERETLDIFLTTFNLEVIIDKQTSKKHWLTILSQIFKPN